MSTILDSLNSSLGAAGAGGDTASSVTSTLTHVLAGVKSSLGGPQGATISGVTKPVVESDRWVLIVDEVILVSATALRYSRRTRVTSMFIMTLDCDGHRRHVDSRLYGVSGMER